ICNNHGGGLQTQTTTQRSGSLLPKKARISLTFRVTLPPTQPDATSPWQSESGSLLEEDGDDDDQQGQRLGCSGMDEGPAAPSRPPDQIGQSGSSGARGRGGYSRGAGGRGRGGRGRGGPVGRGGQAGGGFGNGGGGRGQGATGAGPSYATAAARRAQPRANRAQLPNVVPVIFETCKEAANDQMMFLTWLAANFQGSARAVLTNPMAVSEGYLAFPATPIDHQVFLRGPLRNPALAGRDVKRRLPRTRPLDARTLADVPRPGPTTYTFVVMDVQAQVKEGEFLRHLKEDLGLSVLYCQRVILRATGRPTPMIRVFALNKETAERCCKSREFRPDNVKGANVSVMAPNSAKPLRAAASAVESTRSRTATDRIKRTAQIVEAPTAPTTASALSLPNAIGKRTSEQRRRGLRRRHEQLLLQMTHRGNASGNAGSNSGNVTKSAGSITSSSPTFTNDSKPAAAHRPPKETGPITVDQTTDVDSTWLTAGSRGRKRVAHEATRHEQQANAAQIANREVLTNLWPNTAERPPATEGTGQTMHDVTGRVLAGVVLEGSESHQGLGQLPGASQRQAGDQT
uniref:HTH La-type RNA-binding domain-containing protein n=1 Tax=Macrostomum lignano TaxID=282301 RepID=A0A1I8G3B4_9PLAT